jgi:hypothetical protein
MAAPMQMNAKKDPYTRRLDILIQPCGQLVLEEYVEDRSVRGHFKTGSGRWLP